MLAPNPPQYERLRNSVRPVEKRLRSLSGKTLDQLQEYLSALIQKHGGKSTISFRYTIDDSMNTTILINTMMVEESDEEYGRRIEREEKRWKDYHDPQRKEMLLALKQAQQQAADIRKTLGQLHPWEN